MRAKQLGWAVLALAVGCSGRVIEPTGGGAAAAPDQPGSSSQGLNCSELRASGQMRGISATRLERLTRAQYGYVVRDLLGVSGVSAEFPPDEAPGGFEAGLAPAPLLVEKYVETATALVQSSLTKVIQATPCNRANEGDTACATRVISAFARRAYRRPLAKAEVDRLLTLYTAGRNGGTYEEGVGLMVRAVLTSPHFLYRIELDPATASAGEVVAPSDHEMATRLSFLFWQSMPDEELLAAADSGSLRTPEQIEAQARRLLADLKGRQGVWDFARQWLHLDGLDGLMKDPAAFPSFTPQLASTMKESLRAYVNEVVFEGAGRMETLFNGDFAYVNNALATVYGVAGVTSTSLVRAKVDTTRRAGILTHPGLLAVLGKPVESDPIHRGRFVREKLLCQPIPPPPDNLVIMLPPPSSGKTTRERFSAHSTDPFCASCHRLMDPIGFGFEHYDAIGQYRTTDQSSPVDASGEITSSSGLDGAFYGVPELAGRLATASSVRQCVSRQMFRYAAGRPDLRDDACVLDDLNKKGDSTEWSIRELLLELARSETFRLRRIAQR
jgi:hypothetical protein